MRESVPFNTAFGSSAAIFNSMSLLHKPPIVFREGATNSHGLEEVRVHEVAIGRRDGLRDHVLPTVMTGSHVPVIIHGVRCPGYSEVRWHGCWDRRCLLIHARVVRRRMVCRSGVRTRGRSHVSSHQFLLVLTRLPQSLVSGMHSRSQRMVILHSPDRVDQSLTTWWFSIVMSSRIS